MKSIAIVGSLTTACIFYASTASAGYFTDMGVFSFADLLNEYQNWLLSLSMQAANKSEALSVLASGSGILGFIVGRRYIK